MRAAIVLAAGSSRRFGAANKLLVRHGGVPLVIHAVEAACAAPVARVIVVTGAQSARVAAAVRRPRVKLVRARDHASGMSASLRKGLAALWPIERELFVFLGDMPAIPPHLAGRLARALRPGLAVVRPERALRPGHPVLLRRPSRDTIACLSGERGLASLLGGPVRTISAPRGALLDIDRVRHLRAGTGRIPAAGQRR